MPCPTNYFYHFTLRFIESSKPNPNQISTSNGKSGTVNGAVGTAFQPQSTLLGRACEGCCGESVQKWCLVGGELSCTGSKGAFAGYPCTTQIRMVCICSGFLCGLCVCWQVFVVFFLTVCSYISLAQTMVLCYIANHLLEFLSVLPQIKCA